jgi:hypothetical protein
MKKMNNQAAKNLELISKELLVKNIESNVQIIVETKIKIMVTYSVI